MTAENKAGDSRPRVVILTGGALPDEASAAPDDLEYAEETLAGVRLAREMYRVGYERAAKEHRVGAVWAVDGEDRAAKFAAWATREIDPAYVKHVSDPLAEMLRAAARPEDPS